MTERGRADQTELHRTLIGAFQSGEREAARRINQAVTDTMDRFVGEPAGLPSLKWNASRDGSFINLVGTVGKEHHDIADILRGWAAELDLDARDPLITGSAAYGGLINQSVRVTLLGIVDRDARQAAHPRPTSRPPTGGA